jgi:hypothetical protein
MLAVEFYGRVLSGIRIKAFRIIIAAICLIIYFSQTIPVTYKYFQDKMNSYAYNGPEMVMTHDISDAFIFLKQNLKNHPVILSDGAVGIMLPAYVPAVSYYGHPVHTYDYYGKMGLVRKFYGGLMTDDEALEFLNNGRIDYIFRGPGEAAMGDISKYRITFTKWYENKTVTIYKRG